ncbi:MAG: TlpA disulfide reductase family protein [bacterium]
MMKRSGAKNGMPGAAKLPVILLAALFFFPGTATAVLNIGDSVGKVKLTDGRGKAAAFPLDEKILVVAFWHPRCEPCLKELEILSDKLKGVEGKGVKVVAITRGKDEKERNEAEKVLKGIDRGFVSLYDPDFSVASRHFNVGNGFPLFFIVDKMGKLQTPGISQVAEPVRNLALIDSIGLVRDGKAVPLVEFVPKTDPKMYPAVELVGKEVPEIPSMKDLRGKVHSTEEYRGSKNLMIVFWSTRCPHCKREMPQLQSFYLAHANEFDMEILAYTYANDGKLLEETEEYVKQNQLTYPVIPYDKQDLLNDFKVKGVPCVYVVSREGKIVEMLPGARSDIEQVLVSIFRTYPELQPPVKKEE